MKKSYAEFDIVDYIEATDEEREEIDGEFAGQPAEVAAMHEAGPGQAGCVGMNKINLAIDAYFFNGMKGPELCKTE